MSNEISVVYVCLNLTSGVAILVWYHVVFGGRCLDPRHPRDLHLSAQLRRSERGTHTGIYHKA